MAQTSTASASTIIEITLKEAWMRLQDLSLAHNYVPGITKTEITTDLKCGIGASRKVFQSETKWIDETVEEWNEGSGFIIRLHRGTSGPPLPFKEACFTYEISDSEDHTLLTTTLTYTMRWGAFGKLLDKLAINRIIEGRIRDVAVNMKSYYESGFPVSP